MSAIVVSVISGLAIIAGALLTNFGRRVRRDLDACLRERKQLKQTLNLVVGALVGLLPATQRDQLLVSVATALEDIEEAA